MIQKFINRTFKSLTSFWFAFPSIFFIYILWNTGLHGDDYAEIFRLKDFSLFDFYSASINDLGVFVFGLPIYYSLYWTFPLFGTESLFVYDLIKIFVHIVSYVLVFIFFSDYLKKDRAALAAFLFILFPLHDSTNYWYMALSYILVPSILMFAHHLVARKSYISGLLFSTLGCFAFYASLPIVFGLGIIFLIQKKIKSFFIYIFPGLMYSAYYLFFKIKVDNLEVKINDEISVSQYFLDLIFQFITMIEASIGPSSAIKIFYSVSSITIVSILFLVFILIFLLFFIPKRSFSDIGKANYSLVSGLAFVIVFSLCTYALTGAYWHTPFNLSNRSLIYPSLLLSYLISCFIRPKNFFHIIFCIILLSSILGISDHWKSWNIHQKTVIEKINENQIIQNSDNATFFVSNNLYSQMGAYSYIEFFSMPWNIRAIFKQDLDTNFIAITPYLIVGDDSALDTKSKIVYPIYEKKYFYNSDSGKLKIVSNQEIRDLIEKTDPIHRHWVQFFKGTLVEDFIKKFVPGLSYLFI